MICYFSGTGNSAYTAQRIGRLTGMEILDLFERIRDQDYSPLQTSQPWVIVTPTYAWRIPRIVSEWLEKTPLTGNSKIYFVMTCGGSIGNAGAYLKKFCERKKMDYQGCFPIVMPENYIAMFSTPAPEESEKQLATASPVIEQAAESIKKGECFPELPRTMKDKLNSGIINDLFYPMFVHAKKFTATEACVSCGQCVQGCPLKNIKLEAGHPVWGNDCTHCMACISRCPMEAIEYGKHTQGLPRYTCPESR